MRRILPAVALFALSLGGCSSLPDVTGAFGGSPRPQAAVADNGEYVQAAPRRVQRVRAPAPLPPPQESDVMTNNSDVAGNDVAMASEEPLEPVTPVVRKTVIRPLAPDPELEAAKPITTPVSRSRVNVAAARDQINAYRERAGLPPLVIDTALMQAAKTQSDAMARKDVMDHSVSGSFAKRMARVGVEEVPAAENIAAGYSNVAAVIKGWQTSPAHDANLRMKDATRLGIAAAPSPSQPDKLYWTLIVAGS